MSNVGANASDIGLVVQGTLIFLSAVVAVFGYIIQSRLQQKFHAKQLARERTERHTTARLLELRESLRLKVGPIQAYLQQGHTHLFQFAMSNTGFKSVMPYWFEMIGGKHLFTNAMNHKIHSLVIVDQPFLLDRTVEAIKKEPDSRLARQYRRTMTVVVQKYFEPAALLIAQHMNDLPFPTRDEFKKKFPTLVGDPQLRKILLIRFTNWVYQMRYIIDEEWSVGNFSDISPPHHPYPMAAVNYLVGMVSELKDEISSRTEGQMKFNTITGQEEKKEMLQHVDALPSKVHVETKKEDRGVSDDDGGQETKRTKYAIGAAGGAVGGGVVAAVVGL
jgi:hypothetical protein